MEKYPPLTSVIFALPALTYWHNLFFGSAGLPLTGWENDK
jgi:hypothetical protein